ncbi:MULTISPECIES: DNA methyltransferase [unclassified Nodularia (in: cyanobacteria)]|uniref:DNA methyltransferase n=1 Tax=unclassified Nodularia (in: cyanobacteria) TaxID=2656917 RepID=UPI001880DADB|nr:MULTISPECIES: DNA methyltransferase [unclassified Nodularia (in: cyanobacteria)]MBE9201017.1 class I SAM-dependent DNA methyltransferase [Nodularia sp. LEGE 06071]MCC2694888.1 class I SAM-dependent DNA methyltransferase [Nodularia sp. LEGE 04288]
MAAATPESLNKFVSFCQQHIKGQERKEAQTFLDRFFRAFGHEGALEAGASYEEAIKKSSKTGKTGFADLVWKPRVLIEMKKRGEELSKHYSQAFDYWTRLVPDRPRYVLLCNFDEFWIFDFDIQLDTPVDKISLEQLPERAGAFAFMEFGNKTPIFNNNQVEVTERAARRMGELLLELEKRGIEKLTAQRFILQCVLAMFAEDRQLLPRDMFISCVQDCMAGASSYDVLGGLFREMNLLGKTPAGRYQGVDYFNGGLFSQIQAIDLTREELNFLDVSAKENWSQVRPAIFGNLFEGTVDKKERHAKGIHYTSEADIMKIVRPTISRYWEDRIDAAGSIKALSQLQLELQSYRVLDPACGSGNFLYIAYQELKRIETLLLEKLQQRGKSKDKQMLMGLVTPLQFYGMDTNPFAVELARVTLMIARKIAIDNLQLTEPALPLDSLDKNIVCQDALFSEWPKANAIIGNPPFLGGKHMRIALGDEYIDKVFQRFPDVKDSIDFCAYWFRLAHEHIDEKGRVGLVATNSISQGKSRVATLDYITQNNGYIHEAVSTQPWSGEAKVHVSIVNWCRVKPEKYYLDNQIVSQINSALKSSIDVYQAVRLKANLNKCFQGVIPVGEGFIVTEQQVSDWIKADSHNEEVLKLFSMGANLAKNPHGKPERWIIDFNDKSIEDASDYKLPFEHIKKTVKPQRDNNRDAKARQYWWKFLRHRPEMRTAIYSLSFYLNVPRVSKWAIFIPAPLNWLPGDKSVVIATDDFYILGILSSNIHRTWMHAQKSTLKADIAYTHNTCFETFPFPQTPDAKLVQQIRAKAEELHQYRTQQMESKQWGITTLYNKFFNEPSSQLYKLHEQLDKLVMQAYNFKIKDDILEKLLTLNKELAEKEKQGETVIRPW